MGHWHAASRETPDSPHCVVRQAARRGATSKPDLPLLAIERLAARGNPLKLAEPLDDIYSERARI
jgi:hypothetical protein